MLCAMVTIPSNIQELVSYKPGKPIPEIVKELGLSEWAILWNNENNMGPSPQVLKRIEETAISSHRYPDPASTQLCSMIAQLNHCDVDQVTVDNGSESVFDCMFRAFFEGDDELLTCDGTFVAVYIWAKSNRIPTQRFPLNNGYGFDIQKLIDSVTEKTKAVYVANPNNPTGAMITKAELNHLVDSIPDDKLIVVDEAYYEYAKALSADYPDSFALRKPNVITLRTFSKAYGIAGIRLGYALGDARLIEAIRKVKMTFAPSNVAQAAGIGALEDMPHMQRAVDLNGRALVQFYAALDDLGYRYVPSYGNFVMLDLETEEAAKHFTEDMLKKGVFIRHLRAFGLPHCVRVSTGLDEENQLFVKALR
ncbi:MAG: histidinol-phosphate transaminase [Salibacteraceae bacterium]